MLDIILDGVKASSFGLIVQDRPVISTAKERVEYITVEGRDGQLTKKTGYDNREYEITFTLADNVQLKSAIRKSKAFFFNKKKLSYSDDASVYQIVNNIEIGDIENQLSDVGYFSVKFNVDPFDYAITSTQSFTSSPITITNTGTYLSRPLIKINGSGNVVLTVNGISCQFKGLTNGIVLDCELEEAYWGLATNMNNYMSGDFPTLKPGVNSIVFSGTVSKVEIDGRWRYL